VSTTTTKPAKGTGKQKTPARPASGAAGSAFTSARELLLCPPDGIGELEWETGGCESSAAKAVVGAKPERKLSAFYCGFDELREKLCALASRYYRTCFEIARSNRTELNVDNPADLARSITAKDVSTFLRTTALDGKEAREIASNGRVREFVRNVCLNYPDFQILEADQREATLLPRWPHGRSFGAMLARGPKTLADGDASSTLTLEETKRFILDAEQALIKNLRRAIEHAHRMALVDLGKNGIGGEVIDRFPTRTPSERTPERASEGLVFKQSKMGIPVAQKPINDFALLTSYNEFSHQLGEIRTIVRVTKKKPISGDDLRKQFARTTLAPATKKANWGEWQRDFSSGELTSKNAALVLLEDTTSLNRSTLKSMLSRARSNRKIANEFTSSD